MPTPRKPWTREELLVLLNLYEKIPFGRFHRTNPVLVDVAARMDRSPSSVAMKLSNLASFDERLAARGVRGLAGASALDRQVWDEFHSDRWTCVPRSEELLAELYGAPAEARVEVTPTTARVVPGSASRATETVVQAKARRGQEFFSDAVHNAYGGRCAVTGLSVRALLTASHIIPWAKSEAHRLDPQNGIALNALHDRAFDRGLITFDDDLRLVCSTTLTVHHDRSAVSELFAPYEGRPLHVPAESFGPHPQYLAWHREHVFERR